MARSDSPLLKELRGQLAKSLVIKQYEYGTVVSAYPVMPPDNPTELQGLYRKVFKEAVAYAQSVLRNPATKAEWQERIGKDKSVYHAALKDYLQRHKLR